MRGTRWLILVAILALLGGVGATYRLQQRVLQAEAPQKPSALPVDQNVAAENWHWTQTDGTRTIVDIRARKFGQSQDDTRVDLENVELRLFHKDGSQYNLVRSKRAQFSPVDKRLYSDGEVEITLRVPVEGPPRHQLISIRSSGVTFDSTTGKASTDRAASFTFENGDGTAVGAAYDPTIHELHLNSQVELHWKSKKPNARPLKIEAGELLYKETASTIWLLGWARLTRENTVIDGGGTVVMLEDGEIRKIDAQNAHGVDQYPNRQLHYGADHLFVDVGEDGQVKKITGTEHARLVSTADASETTITAGRVDLTFADFQGEAALTEALASGNGQIEWKPLSGPGSADRQTPDTRVLRSDIILLKMRPGGKEIQAMETHSPGELEFFPNRPGQHHRTLNGERLWIEYGDNNRVRRFRAENARTRTDPLPEKHTPGAAPVLTQSRNLLAHFDEAGEMTRLEQWENFSYEEGERKARASRATLENKENRIELEAGARMWDATGSTAADRITLDQRTGNFVAVGHVSSSRMPDQKKPGSDMLSSDEPLQALAQQMRSANHNRLIDYEGEVVLWQGSDRIQANRVHIDREQRRLTADGAVRTQFLEKPAKDKESKDKGKTAQPSAGWEESKTGSQPETPIFTVVQAPSLLYTEQDRLAHYSGGVLLSRPGLEVKAAEIRAFLTSASSESRMEKAFADGQVKIVQHAPDRTRTGTGEHAEYYTGDNRIVLRGDSPRGSEAAFLDSLKGDTRGAELTYFADDDRLLVNGAPDRRVTSRIRRK